MTTSLSIGLTYKAVFTWLEYYHSTLDTNQDFESLVQSMDPQFWTAPPAEQPIIQEFIGIIKGIDLEKEEVDLVEGFEIMIMLLRRQMESADLDLSSTLIHLQTILREKHSVEWTAWIDNWIQTPESIR